MISSSGQSLSFACSRFVVRTHGNAKIVMLIEAVGTRILSRVAKIIYATT